MADQQLSEQEFNAIAEGVMAKLPKDTTEAQFNKAIDDAVSRAQAQRARSLGPVAGRGTGFSTANQKANATAVSESAPEIGGLVGGAVGSFTPAGPIGGAAIGGGAGSLLRDAARKYRGAENAPSELSDVALGAGWEAGKQAALGKGGELVGRGLGFVGEKIANRGVPLVRSALKIPLAAARQRAGIEGVNPDIAANRISKFIVDERLATPDAARALVKKTGGQIDAATQVVEANPNVSTVLDTAERIPKYLQKVLSNVEKQYLPQGGRSAIQSVGKELVEDSPLSQYVPSTGRIGAPPTPTHSVTGAATPGGGFKFTAPQAEEASALATSRPRALRANVRPSEALDIIREKSFYDPAAGEANRVGKKTIERAVRDSFKEAVPESAAPLLRQGRALDAERVLDRASWRDANRDTVGFGGTVGLVGGHPGLGMISQLLKGGQLRAGIAAPKIGRAVAGAGANSAQIARVVSLLDEILSQEPPH